MLRIEQLSFAFKNRPLFQNLTFEIKAGTLTRLTGPNGAGKSTLIGLITGLIPSADAHIHFSGDEDFRTWTSWISPNANGLFSTLSAVENLDFWLSLRGAMVDKKLMSEMLDQWGLSGPWIQSTLPVSKFSTGMLRRLSLVRILLENSKLWLLDEPLFGLDDSACKFFGEKLAFHVKTGGAALVVTHDERLLENISHHVVKIGETKL